MWIRSSILKCLSQIYQWFPTVESLLLSKKWFIIHWREKVYRNTIVQKNYRKPRFWQTKLPWKSSKFCLFKEPSRNQLLKPLSCLSPQLCSAEDAGGQCAESMPLISGLTTVSLIPHSGQSLTYFVSSFQFLFLVCVTMSPGSKSSCIMVCYSRP